MLWLMFSPPPPEPPLIVPTDACAANDPAPAKSTVPTEPPLTGLSPRLTNILWLVPPAGRSQKPIKSLSPSRTSVSWNGPLNVKGPLDPPKEIDAVGTNPVMLATVPLTVLPVPTGAAAQRFRGPAVSSAWVEYWTITIEAASPVST